jgi:histidinol dehydrogenase
MIRLFQSVADYQSCLQSQRQEDEQLRQVVASILQKVRRDGDAALSLFSREFDGVSRPQLQITSKERREALGVLEEIRSLLEEAAQNIRQFHEMEKKQLSSWRSGDHRNFVGQYWTPLRRVGVYVPGGKAAYPSSVLMNVIPAQVAGVREICLVTPPQAPEGNMHPLVVAAAFYLGVEEIYAVGGAQAIGALAYGTRQIPPVDKIVGPGNRYVAEAKRQVYGQVGVDAVAGPSEVVVVADETAPSSWVAADLLAQAEHDPAARAIALVTQKGKMHAIAAQIEQQLEALPRKEMIRKALQNCGAIVKVESLVQAVQLVNAIAPEHVELMVADPERLLPNIHTAGAVFLGRFAPEAVGDYWAGSNHVLPTSGTARFSSALSVRDFMRWTSVVQYDCQQLQDVRYKIARFARLEGLEAHARSVEIRFEKQE